MNDSVYFYNGRIHPLGSACDMASSLLVSEGRIVALDPQEAVVHGMNPKPKRIDLQGAFVFPGFFDAHIHVMNTGKVMLGYADLDGIDSIDAILERLGQFATSRGNLPVRGWFGGNLQTRFLREGRFPTTSDLDRIAKDRPVMVQDVNKIIVNSFVISGMTLEERRIALIRDGMGDGNLFFGQERMTAYRKCLPPPSAQISMEEAICCTLNQCAANGITSVVASSVNLEECRAFRNLNKAGRLKLNVTMLLYGNLQDKFVEEGIVPGMKEGRLEFGPLKYFWDRNLTDRTCLMHEPFEGHPDNRGQTHMPAEEFRRSLKDTFDAGWPVAVHCAGDRGFDELTTMFAAEKSRMKGLPPSHVIHTYFPTNHSMDICREMNLGLAIQPGFIRSWGDIIPDLVGHSRATRFLPLKSMLNNGMVLGGSSDAPIISLNLFRDMATALSRKALGGLTLNETECLDASTMLKMYTCHAATVMGVGGQRGSLEVGKEADFTVMNQDLSQSNASDILKARVLMTVVGGRVVFRTPEFPCTLL